jgi:hypothetical protein
MDYLALRLCTMSLDKAAAHIQAIHVHKHQAEFYEELDVWLARRFKNMAPPYRDPRLWLDAMNAELVAARKTLERHAASWDTWLPAIRLKYLLAAHSISASNIPDDVT